MTHRCQSAEEAAATSRVILQLGGLKGHVSGERHVETKLKGNRPKVLDLVSPAKRYESVSTTNQVHWEITCTAFAVHIVVDSTLTLLILQIYTQMTLLIVTLQSAMMPSALTCGIGHTDDWSPRGFGTIII